MPERRKVSIVGAGSVGATIAYASLIRGAPKTVALHDIDRDKVRAEVLDLNQGSQFYPAANVIGSEDVAVTSDSDLVVITAGAKQKPGQTRLELAAVNVRRRVFGSGTVLDSSRLRTLLAEHCGVAVHSVDAYIVGEHGDSQVAAWSRASIGGVPVRDWSVPGRPPLDGAALDRIAHEVATAAEQIIRGKGATNFAVGLAAAGIIEAVLHDERSVLPVSSLLGGEYGIEDVCLSLPSIVDAKGVDAVLAPPLAEDEADALRRSAETVRGVERSLGL